MSQTIQNDSLKLIKRLWKGALHVLAVASYISLIIGMLVIGSWLAAFVTLGLVLLAQSLRYIASAMDRIAHSISLRKQRGEDATGSLVLPTLSAITVWILIQGCNAAITLYAFNLSGTESFVRVLVVLVFIEATYLGLRIVNRRIAYEPASFGIADRNVLRTGPVPYEKLAGKEKERIEGNLQRLKKMADTGDISEQAYLRARDKYLVRLVMESRSDDLDVTDSSR
jgi:hypothetical protein